MSTIPEELWFGRTEGEWPIQTWESEAHARAWMLAAGRGKKRIWKAKVVDPVEYDLTRPEPFLAPKESK